MQDLEKIRTIVESLLEHYSGQADDDLASISEDDLPAFLTAYMRNPKLRANPWPEVKLTSKPHASKTQAS
jgi:hypothetical protein